MGELVVVVGGQFGSEGKGAVVGHLASKLDAPVVVRVAGSNAGHSAVDDQGNKWALRTIPIAAVTNRDAMLLIAAGSEIDVSVLDDEFTRLTTAGYNIVDRLHIDPQATLQTKEHQRTEQLAGITERLGSTAKGIGAARSARIWREAELYGERGAFLGNTAHIMRDQLQLGNTVIIEGTQGYGLGLHAGHYPQCTSSDCRALDFLAMAGISPWDQAVDKFTVWVTARVNPIRVAGNSGQLLGETTWEQLGLAEEHTTVTKKVRRVGEWDPDLIREAVQANGGAPVVKIALTMVDHLEPEIEGLTGPYELDEMPETVQDLVRQVERDANAPVGLIGTSDRTMITLGAFRG